MAALVLLTDEPCAESYLLFHKSVSSLDKPQLDMNEQNLFRFAFEARNNVTSGRKHTVNCQKLCRRSHNN